MHAAVSQHANGEAVAQQPHASSARYWVWVVMFAQYFGLGLMRPEMPGILLSLWDGHMQSVAVYQGLTDAVGALVAFALVPMIGDLSDRRGRKPALLISALAAAAPVFVLALYESVFGARVTLILFAAVSLVSKLNSYSVALAYVADCSSLEKRSAAFGEVSGMMFLGLTGGPFVSSFLPRSTAMLTAAALNVAAALYIVFVLPESHKGDKAADDEGSLPASGNGEKQALLQGERKPSYTQQPQQPEQSSNGKKDPPHGIMMAWTFLTQNRITALIGAITLVSQLAVFGVGQIYYLYLTEELSFVRGDTIRAALIGGCETAGVMTLVMPALSHRMHESLVMAISLAAYMIYSLGLALAVSSKMQAYGLIAFWAVSGMLFPSTCSLLSSYTDEKSTGLAQGALSAVRCLASGMGPAVFALFFSATVSLKHNALGPQQINYAQDSARFLGLVHYTALPLILGALLIGVALVMTLYLPSTRLHPSVAKNLQHEGANPEKDERVAVSSARKVSAGASPSLQDKWGFVRRRHGGHLIPAISGHFTYHDAWQHIAAHLRRNKHTGHGYQRLRSSETDEEQHIQKQQRQPAQQSKSGAKPTTVAGVSTTFSSSSSATAASQLSDSPSASGGVVQAPPRSAASRWSILLLLTGVVVGSLILISFIGHFFPADAAVQKHSNGKQAQHNDLLQVHADLFDNHLTGEVDDEVEEAQEHQQWQPARAHLAGLTTLLASHQERISNPKQQGSAIVLSLMGPPGVGKTALSRHLTAAYGLVPLSSGALMRSEISRGTALGAKVKQRVESGGLVDDDLVLQLVETEVARLLTSGTDGGLNDTFTGVILDGFPRTLAQARMLDEHNSSIPHIAAMIYVHMNESVLAERREGRRVCPKCGLTFNLNPIDHDGYHLKARVPKGDNEMCDVDGARLERREDDQPAIAEKRMAAFHNLSLPMADYYDKQGKLISIEKTRGSGALFKIIRPTLEEMIRKQQVGRSQKRKQTT